MLRTLLVAAPLLLGVTIPASALQTVPCHINIDNVDRMPGGTPVYSGAFYNSWYRITVRMPMPSCEWALQLTGLPPWLKFHQRSGTLVSRTSKHAHYRGSVVFDVEMARNPGNYRSGSYTVIGPTYSIRSDVGQGGRQGVCIRQPVSTDGTSTVSMEDGQFRAFIRRWSTATPPNKAHVFLLKDAAGCTPNAMPMYYTLRANGSTIAPASYKKTDPLRIAMPYAPPNQSGDAALFSLRGNSGAPDVGAVATLMLPALDTLPLDLRITGQNMSRNFLAFGAQGGYIEVTGTVTRSSKDPKRRCAFDPSLYTVVGSDFRIVPELSGCTSSPDAGKITVLAARKNGTGRSRLGLIFTPWGGWTAFLIQPTGG